MICVCTPSAQGAWADRGVDALDLSDLGYGDGLTLQGQGARQTVFFPVPPDAEGARLTLEADFSQALDRQSGLTVRVDGEPMKTVLARDGTSRRITLDLPKRLLDDAFLPVELAGDLAVSREACADNTSSSVWARLRPESGIAFSATGKARTLADRWRTLSGEVRVALLPAPSNGEIVAALAVMADLQRRGIEPVPVLMTADAPAQLPEIVIGDVPWPRVEAISGEPGAALTLLQSPESDADDSPALWVRGPDAAHLLATRDDLLRGQSHVQRVDLRTLPEFRPSGSDTDGDGPKLTFAALGHGTREAVFTSRGEFRVDLPIARIPSGYVPEAVELTLRGPDMGENDALLVDTYINETYAESVRLADEAILNGKRIPVSKALLGGNNGVQIKLQRLAPRRPCEVGVVTTVQMHGSSSFDLVPGEFKPARLRDWTARYDETVEIILPDGINARLRAMPLVARLLAEGTLAGTDIRLVDDPGGSGPFIHVADTPPEAYADLPVTTDRGRVRINTADGRALTFDPGSEVTLIELVQRGSDWGVWIAPGARVDMPLDRGLGDGDVALLPPRGAPVVLNTRTDTFDVTYPESRDPLALLKRYDDYLFWGFWVVLSLVVAVVVIRMRRQQGAT